MWADVQRAARDAAELDVTIDLELLAERRPAKHAQPRARAALIDDAARGKRFDLAVCDGCPIELGDVLHAGTHHAGALHAVAVIGEGARTLHDHVTDLSEHLAPLAARERADRAHVHHAGTPPVIDLVSDLGAGVSHGVGVWHRGDVGEPAVRGGTAARLDGLLVFEARDRGSARACQRDQGTRYFPEASITSASAGGSRATADLGR